MSIAEQCTFLHHVILKCETEPYMQHYRYILEQVQSWELNSPLIQDVRRRSEDRNCKVQIHINEQGDNIEKY